MFLVVAIGFLLNLVDGFDVVAMSVAGPSITSEWGITDNQKGFILSAALVGMAIGAAIIAPYSDVVGRRKMILLATLMIGASMIVTGFIPNSVSLMMAIRVVSGLGIGVIMASGAAIATEFAPERYRNLAVTMVVMGYPFGAMVIGPIASFIIPRQGWAMLFVYGGAATLLLGAVLFFVLPESVEFLAQKKSLTERDLLQVNAILKRLKREPLLEFPPRLHDSQVKSANVVSLFENNHALDTMFLWGIYFLGFLTLYFLMSWIPSLFVDAGFTRNQGIFALSVYNFGAVVGIIVIGLLTTKVRLAKPIGFFFLGSAVFLGWLYGFRPQSPSVLNGVIFMIGVLLQGGFTAMYALAARIYPTSIRATGIGWGAGIGRTGAIISPTVAGFLSAAGWDIYDLSLLFAIPLVVAGVLVMRYKV
jgi:MFS transporter, AAHS family, vanillate permease